MRFKDAICLKQMILYDITALIEMVSNSYSHLIENIYLLVSSISFRKSSPYCMQIKNQWSLTTPFKNIISVNFALNIISIHNIPFCNSNSFTLVLLTLFFYWHKNTRLLHSKNHVDIEKNGRKKSKMRLTDYCLTA